MHRNLCVFRLTTGAALSATFLSAVLPVPAVAQPAPPPLPQPYQAQPSQSQVDPPERVGRVARLGGTVSLRVKGDEQWSPASVNYPVSSGDAFWTEPAGSAELEIADTRIALASTTEFLVATLDSNGLQAIAAQGEVYLHLHNLPASEVWSVQTPRGLVRLNTEGRYLVSVGSTEQPTRVTVLDGSAEVQGPDLALRVEAGQTATIDGTSSFKGSVGPAVKDAFLIGRLDAEQPRPAPPAPIPAQVAAMPGGSDLTGYGRWSEAADYGQVWYPPVSSGWVPYREGHWAYVAPWGWTWIDDAPWGFAPFHYGRWIEIGGRWAWTPGVRSESASPVYAPALVTFIGVGAGVALGAALASNAIGWVPLGPREPYHPWYHASDRYIRAVNVSHVTNITNNVTVNTYVNQRAATLVPGAEMARSRPVQAIAQPLTPQQLAAARPIVGEQPVRPTVQTAGVTPAVARTFHLPPSALPRPAPGPALHPQAPGPANGGVFRPAATVPGSGGPAPSGLENTRPPQSSHAPVPPLATPGVRPASLPTPQASGPPQSPPVDARRTEPAASAPAAPTARPEPPAHADARPLPQAAGAAHPEPQHVAPPPPMPHVATPGPVVNETQHAAPHQEPPHLAAPVPRPEPQHVAPPPSMPHVATPGPVVNETQHAAPRQEPPHLAAPMPHPEPQHVAPPAPRQEPPHVAPPVARQEPPHFAAPAPHPEPPHPVGPPTAERPKRPGEH